MRNSQKRNKIIDLFKNNHLLTANEICDLLPNIDRATIYRNLNVFSRSGLLKEINLKKGITSYEINNEDNSHQHLICTNCDNVSSIKIDFNALSKYIPKSFKLTNIELNLKGLCEKCKFQY